MLEAQGAIGKADDRASGRKAPGRATRAPASEDAHKTKGRMKMRANRGVSRNANRHVSKIANRGVSKIANEIREDIFIINLIGCINLFCTNRGLISPLARVRMCVRAGGAA